MNYINVAIGGALGAVLRFALMQWQHNNYIPWHTLVINVVGCLTIGVLWSLMGTQRIGSNAYNMLAIGVCGGFTTFSSFSLENIQLLNNQNWFKFALYTVGTMFCCILATAIGIKIINYLVHD